MQGDGPISVLILYSHPLLGEGLVGMLAHEPDLVVSAVGLVDSEAVRVALDESPQVVIAERGQPDRAVEILERVPEALIIEVGLGPGPTFTYRRDEISTLPESVVEAVRQGSRRPCARRAGVGGATPKATVRG